MFIPPRPHNGGNKNISFLCCPRFKRNPDEKIECRHDSPLYTWGWVEEAVEKVLSVVAWVTEGYRLARTNAYTAPKDGRIGQDYLDKNIPVIERRLSVAGVRLAALLNAVFDESKAMPF